MGIRGSEPSEPVPSDSEWSGKRVGEQNRVFFVEQAARGRGDGKIRLEIQGEESLAGS